MSPLFGASVKRELTVVCGKEVLYSGIIAQISQSDCTAKFCGGTKMLTRPPFPLGVLKGCLGKRLCILQLLLCCDVRSCLQLKGPFSHFIASHVDDELMPTVATMSSWCVHAEITAPSGSSIGQHVHQTVHTCAIGLDPPQNKLVILTI